MNLDGGSSITSERREDGLCVEISPECTERWDMGKTNLVGHTGEVAPNNQGFGIPESKIRSEKGIIWELVTENFYKWQKSSDQRTTSNILIESKKKTFKWSR